MNHRTVINIRIFAQQFSVKVSPGFSQQHKAFVHIHIRIPCHSGRICKRKMLIDCLFLPRTAVSIERGQNRLLQLPVGGRLQRIGAESHACAKGIRFIAVLTPTQIKETALSPYLPQLIAPLIGNGHEGGITCYLAGIPLLVVISFTHRPPVLPVPQVPGNRQMGLIAGSRAVLCNGDEVHAVMPFPPKYAGTVRKLVLQLHHRSTLHRCLQFPIDFFHLLRCDLAVSPVFSPWNHSISSLCTLFSFLSADTDMPSKATPLPRLS